MSASVSVLPVIVAGVLVGVGVEVIGTTGVERVAFVRVCVDCAVDVQALSMSKRQHSTMEVIASFLVVDIVSSLLNRTGKVVRINVYNEVVENNSLSCCLKHFLVLDHFRCLWNRIPV